MNRLSLRLLIFFVYNQVSHYRTNRLVLKNNFFRGKFQINAMVHTSRPLLMSRVISSINTSFIQMILPVYSADILEKVWVMIYCSYVLLIPQKFSLKTKPPYSNNFNIIIHSSGLRLFRGSIEAYMHWAYCSLCDHRVPQKLIHYSFRLSKNWKN